MAAKTKWGEVKDRITGSPAHDPDATLEANLESADPELCIRLLQVPTVINYSGLRRRLEASDRAWMVQFLELRGLDLLMEALERLSGRGCARIADALLQLTCVACIRAVMNSSEGLHFILDNQGYVRTLTQALDTSNVMVKMQVFELLAALALFDPRGRHLSLDALDHYKSLKKQRYRFSAIMNELHATDNVPYMVTLMSVINVLLLGQEDLRKRDRLRQEFIGLKLLDLLPRLRETEDEDLNIQCDAFEDSLTEDEEEMERLYGGIDMSSHQQVFTSLFTKISSSPSSVQLLSILQALLLVDPDRAEVWLALELLADRAILLSQDDDIDSADCLLQRLLPQKSFAANHRIRTMDRAIQTQLPYTPTGQSDMIIKYSTPTSASAPPVQSPTTPSTPTLPGLGLPPPPPLPGVGPPPPPPLPGMGPPPPHPLPGMGPPPPPPLPGMGPPPPLPGMGPPPPPPLPGMGPPPPPPLPGMGPPPPPPLPGMGPPPPLPGMGPPPPPPLPGMGPPPPPPLAGMGPPPPLPGMGPPPPPPLPGMGPPPPPPLAGMGPPPPLPGMGSPPSAPGEIIIAQTVQSLASSYYSSAPAVSSTPCPSLRMKKLNWQKLPSRALTAHQSLWTSVSSDSVEPDYCSIEQLFSLPPTETKTRTKAKAQPKEISFIDAKKSLNLNIFLKQFRCSHEDFVSLITRGDRSKFDVEVLKQLIKLLPEKHEIENLKHHQSDRGKLASVDQFYLLLLGVSSYPLRLDCMLLCEESSCVLETLKPKVDLLDRACRSVRESVRLPSFCKLILSVGNFLNYGTHTGNAEGFRISTLLKLTETKANTSRITLLHHILEEVEKNHPDLLILPDDLEICEKAAGVNLESIKSENSALISRLRTSEKKVLSSSEDVQEQYLSQIQESLQACEQLQQILSSMEDRRTDLSVYLCEDSSSFSIDDLFSTIKTFRELFLKAIKENENRKQLEKRRRQQEEEKKRRGDTAKINRKEVSVQDEGCIIDNLLADIRKGYNLKKTRPRAERGSRVHDHPPTTRRSLALDQLDSAVSIQSEEPAGTVQISTEPPAKARPESVSAEKDPSETQNSSEHSNSPHPPAAAADSEEIHYQTRDQNSEENSGPGPETGDRRKDDSEFEEIESLEVRKPDSRPEKPAKKCRTGPAGAVVGSKPKSKKGCVTH